MNLENIGKDCPCYEVDCSDIMFDIGEFCGLPPNNGKLTIQVNGSTVGDFSANQQEDETINITTPTSQDIADAVDGEARLRAEADNTLQSNINAEELARQRADRDIQAVLDGESLARENEDRNLQSQIDAIASKSDVVDVVGTYAELQAYDTSKLNDNDVVKVLDDSTHNDSMTYYRWNKTTQTWSYIGQESPYYSKSQTDNLLAQKQDNLTAGTGITLNGSTISADTTVLAEKSELDNYAEKSDTYTKTEVDNLVEPKLSVEVVEQLPVQGEESKLYLTPKAHTTQTATGNPITATVTDGAGQIEDFQLDGDTFQQSYTGKNILPLKNVENGGITSTYNYLTGELVSSGTSTQNYPRLVEKTNITISSGSTVCFSSQETHSHDIIIRFYYDASNYIYTSIDTGNTSSVRAITQDIVAVEVLYYTGTNVAVNESFKLMLEIGSSATTFEPYVGGIASPNPTYPQPIQVVTGTQTIAINGTDYPLDLGTIELCKLGGYQDYIWKDGGDWKVHKATGKTTFTGDASEGWFRSGNTTETVFCATKNINALTIPTALSVRQLSKMDRFTWHNTSPYGIGNFDIYNQSGNYANNILLTFDITKVADITAVTTWITDNKPTLYYPIYTATDTAITDSTLIAQLNAIASASLENGSNTITNTATGSNLAGDMEVDYFGYDPTNRYDKWLWLDINNAYEKLGS